MPDQNFARPGRRQNTTTTTFVTSGADSKHNPPVAFRPVVKAATVDKWIEVMEKGLQGNPPKSVTTDFLDRSCELMSWLLSQCSQILF